MILSIQHSMQADLQSASEWFQCNGIGLYVDKCLSIWVGSNSEDLPLQLGNRNLQLSSSMKLLGITIDNALNFHGHVSELVCKVSIQLQVLKRHKRLIPTGAKKRLYEALILSHLNYCSSIWNHCTAKRMLIKWRKLMRDVSALSSMTFAALMMNYWITLTSPVYKTAECMICWLLLIEHLMVTPLYILRIDSMKEIPLITYVANIFSMSPGLILQTTVYGLHFFCYSACKLWNSLPNSFRTARTTNAVNHLIKFNHDCCSVCNLA